MVKTGHSLREKFIGDRKFYRRLLAISVPIMVQTGITNFVSLLDNIMVGRTGTEQMSGVAIVNQLLFVFYLCVFGGFAGAGIFTAQYYGAGDEEGIRHTFRYKMLMGIVLCGAAVTVFLCFGDRLIGHYLHGSDDGGDLAATLSYASDYLKIILIGLPAFTLVQVYANTLRECGETVVPMRAGLIAVAVNLVFNYLLIYGKLGFPRLGVRGAAIATVLSRFAEMSVVVIWTHTHREKCGYIKGVYKTLAVPAPLVKKYFITGSPLLVNEALWSAGMAVLTLQRRVLRHGRLHRHNNRPASRCGEFQKGKRRGQQNHRLCRLYRRACRRRHFRDLAFLPPDIQYDRRGKAHRDSVSYGPGDIHPADGPASHLLFHAPLGRQNNSHVFV